MVAELPPFSRETQGLRPFHPERARSRQGKHKETQTLQGDGIGTLFIGGRAQGALMPHANKEVTRKLYTGNFQKYRHRNFPQNSNSSSPAILKRSFYHESVGLSWKCKFCFTFAKHSK